jgi:hypothetical protein
MPKRTPVQTVTVVREGKAMHPTIGKPFNFTEDEIEQIEATNPDAISTRIEVEVEDDPAETVAAKPAGRGKKASAEGL